MMNIFKSLSWNKVSFVKKIHESGDVYTFVFKPDDPMAWKAGQYIDYKLGPGLIKHFTIAASPTEKDLLITTRIFDEPSRFKSKLLSLKEKDQVQVSHAQGDLFIDDPSVEYIFIAGGIGITPFRSIIWDMVDTASKTKVTLLYASALPNPPFRAELDKITASHPNITIRYFLGDRRISTEDIEKFNLQKTRFLISGPPKMVEAYQKLLADLRVPKNNIKADPFIGYFD